MTNIIIRIDGGIVQEVYTELPGFDVTVIDQDVEGAESEEIIKVNDEECYVYRQDVQTYDPDKTQNTAKQIKAEQEAEYFVFGESFSKEYYTREFKDILADMEKEFYSYTFSMHKYVAGTPISEVLADMEGWSGFASVTREEWHQLDELQERMDQKKE